MRDVLEYDIALAPGYCDHTEQLSVPETFRLFQDIAAVHAQSLGLGYYHLLEKDLFWLTVKTKILFREVPRLTDTVTVRTWPEAPGKLRCNRSYEIDCGGETVIVGRTEWAIFNFKENTLARADRIYPEELTLTRGPSLSEPFARIPDQADAYEPYFEYTVRSTDIDIGQHMNNVAYIRAIASSFSTKEWDALPKHSIDLLYRTPCYEGDKLCFHKRSEDRCTDIRITKDGAPLLLARFE